MSLKQHVDIIPAVVPHDFADLEERLTLIKTFARAVQIDVVDGQYARGKTWPYRDRHTFDKIVQQEHGIPSWDVLDFEFDLMVNDAAATVMQYVHAGASRIIIHAA